MQHSVILLDIEGTTTSISFVYDELFPWIRRELSRWLATHWEQTETRSMVDALRAQELDDRASGLTVPPIAAWSEPADIVRSSVAANVLAQMDGDRKTTALKRLQGVMWADGYARGELRGHVFDDVAPAFERWGTRRQRVCIYSSGSIAAQKLLFSHSTAGDLTPRIEAYFDTTTGPKKDAASYAAIAAALGVDTAAVVFLSDNPEELVAARAAGMAAVLAVRPGNPTVPEADFIASSDFRLVD